MILPIYGVEKYLKKCLETLACQTYRKLQIILVDDGSPDRCGEICDEYTTRDSRFEVVHKKNGGVAEARNTGLKYARGKYIAWADPDDWVDEDFISYLVENAERCGSDITICGRILEYADHTETVCWPEERILTREQAFSELFLDKEMGSYLWDKLWRRELFDGICFPSRRHFEDYSIIHNLFLRAERIFCLPEAKYHYLQREDSLVRSAMLTAKIDFFLAAKQRFDDLVSVLPQYEKALAGNCAAIAATVWPVYFHSTRAQRRESDKTLDEIAAFVRAHGNAALESRGYGLAGRILLRLARHKSLPAFACAAVVNAAYEKKKQRHPVDPPAEVTDEAECMEICNLDLCGDELLITGLLTAGANVSAYALIGGSSCRRVPAEWFTPDVRTQANGTRGFRFHIPLGGVCFLEFFLLNGNDERQLTVHFGEACRLSDELTSAYLAQDGWLFSKDTERKEILISPFSSAQRLRLELRVWRELFGRKDYSTLGWRMLLFFGRLLRRYARKEYWVFLDQFSSAGDNAEYLFRYVMSQQNPNIKACFTVSKDSPDYERLRQYGRVIACDTKRYRLAVALCDKLISSQTFLNQRNTFYHRHTIVKDLFRFRFVYLQHGVIKDNHANSQAHYKMAVDIFAASAEKEYASLLSEEYQLSPKIVKLTGLARYDVLSAEKMPSANKILLAPTWRNVRDEQWDEPHQRFYYQPDFRSSAFYRFYNSILTDPRVLATAERNGFQLELQLHPRLWEQRCDFEESTCVHIIQNRLPLEEELRQTVLLVTDYSSIAFDYAYAYTPILYTQFDRETFYETHGYTRGYFDYEQDGFGPVCLDYESAVETLVQMMNGGCQLDECYRMRIDTFFAFHDKENCRRIYEQILKLPGGIQE